MQPCVLWPLGIVIVVALCIYDPLYMEDIQYFIYHMLHKPCFSEFISGVSSPKNPNVLFVTFDTRPELPFVELHNESVRRFCKRGGHTYLFLPDSPPKGVHMYWHKLFVVQKALRENPTHDYVFWLDSDTVIAKPDYDMNELFVANPFADIIIARDESTLSFFRLNYMTNFTMDVEVLNAGVFIVRNSETGRAFIDDCIHELLKNKEKCYNESTGGLNGFWAGLCYEQGVMNELIKSKYAANTAIVPNYFFMNTRHCTPEKNTFILHLNGRSEDARKTCFSRVLSRSESMLPDR